MGKASRGRCRHRQPRALGASACRSRTGARDPTPRNRRPRQRGSGVTKAGAGRPRALETLCPPTRRNSRRSSHASSMGRMDRSARAARNAGPHPPGRRAHDSRGASPDGLRRSCRLDGSPRRFERTPHAALATPERLPLRKSLGRAHRRRARYELSSGARTRPRGANVSEKNRGGPASARPEASRARGGTSTLGRAGVERKARSQARDRRCHEANRLQLPVRRSQERPRQSAVFLSSRNRSREPGYPSRFRDTRAGGRELERRPPRLAGAARARARHRRDRVRSRFSRGRAPARRAGGRRARHGTLSRRREPITRANRSAPNTNGDARENSPPSTAISSPPKARERCFEPTG